MTTKESPFNPSPEMEQEQEILAEIEVALIEGDQRDQYNIHDSKSLLGVIRGSIDNINASDMRVGGNREWMREEMCKIGALVVATIRRIDLELLEK